MALAQKLLHQGPGCAASLQAASWELEADTSKWLMPSNISPGSSLTLPPASPIHGNTLSHKASTRIEDGKLTNIKSLQ